MLGGNKDAYKNT